MPKRKAVSLASSFPANPRRRVVLLLDLDCFYAQCETVRLKLDREKPLALLQWNSALAVNYPARSFGVKRGDSFEAIKGKAAEASTDCVALHLPVIPVGGSCPSEDSDREGTETDFGSADESMEEAYDREYNLPEDVARERFRAERDRMHSPHEGKASLERYRIASSRIFSVVTEALSDYVGRSNFTLERASIDELFLDVSDHCYHTERPAWCLKNKCDGVEDDDGVEEDQALANLAQSETVICARETVDVDVMDAQDERRALKRGCVVARGVRRAVFETLGFTLSAGISTCKLVAKLGASYGKPNGQAIIYPAAVSEIMEKTKIRKVRHLGGKIGKKVLSLLPESEETMGSIARLLSLGALSEALGSELGQMVFDASRGIDAEPVKETEGALTKSITSFKSFPAANNLHALEKWINLLATDVTSRVELDTRRNERVPKSCNIQYIYTQRSSSGERVTRSVRIPFPNTASPARKSQLMDRVRTALESKHHFPIHRLGLSAVDFQSQRPRGRGIESFFSTTEGVGGGTKITGTSPKSNPVAKVTNKEVAAASPNKSMVLASVQCAEDETFARELQKRLNQERPTHTESNASLSAPQFQNAALPAATPVSAKPTVASMCDAVTSCGDDSDADLAYARRLQDSYDKEHKLFSTLEGGRRTGKVAEKRGPFQRSSHGRGAQSKGRQINSFFAAKK